MAFIIPSKSGLPIKLTDRFLIKPKVADSKQSLPHFVPVSFVKSPLSFPEKPTTTNIKQATANIPLRHAVMFSRVPDRGGNTPFLGIIKTLPNLKKGGAPNRITPVLLDVARKTRKIIPANATIAAKLQSVIRKAAMTQDRLRKRFRPRISPGNGGLEFAKEPRRYVDAITGKLKMRSAFPIIRKKAFGVFSQHRTAPKEIVNKLAAVSARKRASLITAQNTVLASGTKRESERPTLTVERLDDTTSIAVPNATAVAVENRGGERFLFLAAVAVIGYMALKGGANV